MRQYPLLIFSYTSIRHRSSQMFSHYLLLRSSTIGQTPSNRKTWGKHEGGGSQSSQVHKKGAQKGLKTPFRPYIFWKIFTKFPSSEKGGGSRFLTLFPSSQSSQPPQGGGVNRGWEFFPSFTMLEFWRLPLPPWCYFSCVSSSNKYKLTDKLCI